MERDEPTKKTRKLWTWDIESVDWDQVRCVVAVSEDGDVERWSGPGALERCAEHMDAVRGTFCAHAGGIYDTLLLSNVRQKPWQELIMSGSAVLMAKDRSLRVRDTFRWWLSGLKKVGQYLDKCDHERRAKGVPEHAPAGHWLKRDVDRGRIADLTDAECLAYCESDCEILMEGCKASLDYLEGYGARKAWTSGSAAIALLQAVEPASWALLRRHSLELDVAIRAADCVRGARVEAWALGRVDRVWTYDFKSAYPSSYMDQPIGVGAVQLDAGARDRPGAVWRCRWRWPWRDRVPPVLDQLTGAGAGWCEAWLIAEERAALELEGVQVQRMEGWAPATMAPIGQVFCRDLYEEKERGSFFAKVFLNSLHGKFSESAIKEAWKSGEKPAEWYGPAPTLVGDYWRYLDVSVGEDGRTAPHLQPLAAAHILGRARTKLWAAIRAVLEAGGEIYYCDTDSIHCNVPPEKMPMELGTQLGQLAPEGGPFVGYYVGPKAYALADPVSGVVQKGALKGVPWNDLRDGVVGRETIRRDGRDVTAEVFRRAEGKEKGRDLRLEVFERALKTRDGATIKKEGITTWVQGLKRDGWQRFETSRTIKPHERGKTFSGESPTVWAYHSPSEVLGTRGLDFSAQRRSGLGENIDEQDADDENAAADGKTR
jgi:hypothetical protein